MSSQKPAASTTPPGNLLNRYVPSICMDTVTATVALRGERRA